VSPGRPPRVVLAAVGDPESPGTWSGVTLGVLEGLRGLGVYASGLDLELPSVLERAMLLTASAWTGNRYDAHGAALAVGVRSRLAARHLGSAGVDGVVQIGTTFRVPTGLAHVTLEDMTLRQANAVHPVFGRMSTRGIAGWEARRAGIYEGARMCTAASHWAADSLLTDYGIAPERVAVVGFGANHLPGPRELQGGAPRFLFVGIDWERKGGPVLLRAFSRLRESCPDATLDIVGGHPPLSLPGVRGHGVLSQARLEDRERILALFARASCLVMPSLVEPFGIVYVEAASAGIPSIVSGEGGARDIVGEEGGAVVQPGDEDGLLEAMLRLADPVTAREMGEAARERSRLYTWSKVAERLLRALGLSTPDGRPPAEFL
jgi:glycosyltransferase involved in cell wall biosynthesis